MSVILHGDGLHKLYVGTASGGQVKIICPHCNKAFKIDEAGYADILKQVRDGAFEQQLHERLELAQQDKRNAVELAQAQVASDMQKSAVAKDSEIQALKAKLDAAELARKLAVTEALSDVQKERDALANEIAQAKLEKLAATELAEAKLASGLQNAAATKDAEIQGLKAKLDATELAQKLAITEALNGVERERRAEEWPGAALRNGVQGNSRRACTTLTTLMEVAVTW
jgi:hypothetical protein